MTIKQQGGVFGRNPTFNDLSVEGTLTVGGSPLPSISNTALLDADQTFTGDLLFKRTGTLNIPIIESTTSNAGIEFKADSSGDNKGNWFISGDPTSAGGLFFYDRSASAVRMKLEHNADVTISSGNLVIGTSGKGIDFSATSGTGTSELFDDYEEGTWTPVLTTDGTDFDDVDYNSNRSGYYRKIGNAVFITGYMRTNSTTVGSATGNVLIAGLPYTSVSTNRSAMAVTLAENWAGEEPLSLYMGGNTTSMGVRYRAGVTTADLETQAADVGTNNILAFSGIYFT